MLEIVRGSFDKNAIVKRQLDEYFSTNSDNYDGILYLGYPIIGDGVSVDALWVSPTYSIIVFDLYEGAASDYKKREEQRDFLYNEINSSLMTNKDLMSRRVQLFKISVYTFAPSCNNVEDNCEEVIFDLKTLNSKLREPWQYSDKYKILLSAIQVATKIRGSSTRDIKNSESKGAILRDIENSIATLDISQNKAVIETSPEIQRIRGLAGSGKTIILALKAAYLHSQSPDLTIAITFNTRSLKPMFLSYINRFVWEYAKREPDFSKIRILNAWGGLRDSGLYSEICDICNISYINFKQAKSYSYISGDDPFEYVCDDALNKIIGKEKPLYDIILIDEAQDLPSPFFKLCKKVLKKDGRLVIAYDELQNLTTGSPLNIKETFKAVDFENKPNEPKKDIILPVCYRNPREIIVTAHAIGFGIYRENKGKRELVQFFDNPNLWSDVGYEVLAGQLKAGQQVILSRTKDSSPTFNKYNKNDIIDCKRFADVNEEAEWVCEQIHKNIENDELRMRDILVIVMATKLQESYAGLFRNILHEKYNYNSHIAGITTSADSFFQDDSITFSGIFRAKGNEAAIVYIVGIQNCMTSTGTIRKHRNELFTAITRSKMWVRITGVGDNVSILESEIQKIKDNDFTLNFEYPTEDELKRIDKIYSDYSDQSLHKIRKIVSLIQNGTINYEDLSEDMKQQLLEGFEE